MTISHVTTILAVDLQLSNVTASHHLWSRKKVSFWSEEHDICCYENDYFAYCGVPNKLMYNFGAQS